MPEWGAASLGWANGADRAPFTARLPAHQAPDAIDFAAYRKQLAGNADLVDLFEKSYKGAPACERIHLGVRTPQPGRCSPCMPLAPPALKMPTYKGDEETKLAEKMQQLVRCEHEHRLLVDRASSALTLPSLG